MFEKFNREVLRRKILLPCTSNEGIIATVGFFATRRQSENSKSKSGTGTGSLCT